MVTNIMVKECALYFIERLGMSSINQKLHNSVKWMDTVYGVNERKWLMADVSGLFFTVI